jgi:putative hydrolase
MIKIGEMYLSGITDRIGREIPLVDFHIHTSWTDGLNNVRELYDQACRLNLESILFSEHARKSSRDWFPQFAEEVRSLPKKPCLALVGVEARVADSKGNLDITQEILSYCDLVIGSVHRFPGENGDPLSFEEVHPDKALDIEFRLTKALLGNPAIQIIGHPFGMCYAQFGLTPQEDMILHLVQRAAEKNVAFEVNSKYHPDLWSLIKICKKTRSLISIGSDAHSTVEVGRVIRELEKGKRK